MIKMNEEIGEMPNDAQEVENPSEENAPENASELSQPRWALISFDSIIAAGLDYDTAAEFLRAKQAEKIAGLCIITDEAAARMKRERK